MVSSGSYDRRIHGPWKYLHDIFGKKCIGVVCTDCNFRIGVEECAEMGHTFDTPCPNCGAQKAKEEPRDHKD